jgi:hypothetical protein
MDPEDLSQMTKNHIRLNRGPMQRRFSGCGWMV